MSTETVWLTRKLKQQKFWYVADPRSGYLSWLVLAQETPFFAYLCVGLIFCD